MIESHTSMTTIGMLHRAVQNQECVTGYTTTRVQHGTTPLSQHGQHYISKDHSAPCVLSKAFFSEFSASEQNCAKISSFETV